MCDESPEWMGWDRVVEGITSTFEALCENENEMIVLDIFAARAFVLGWLQVEIEWELKA